MTKTIRAYGFCPQLAIARTTCTVTVPVSCLAKRVIFFSICFLFAEPTICRTANKFNKASHFSCAMVVQTHISAETTEHVMFFVIHDLIYSTHDKNFFFDLQKASMKGRIYQRCVCLQVIIKNHCYEEHLLNNHRHFS